MVGRSRGVVVRVRDVMRGVQGGVAIKIASSWRVSDAAISIFTIKTEWRLGSHLIYAMNSLLKLFFLIFYTLERFREKAENARDFCRPASDLKRAAKIFRSHASVLL